MDTNKMREQFEAWAVRAKAHGEHFDLSRGNHGAYKSPITHWLYCSWVASWQASREAVVIELPEPQQKPEIGASQYREGKADGIESGIIQCIKAIERQGLKVEA